MPNVGESSDPIVTRLVQEDKVPWYKKPNLRVMYVWLFLCCMGVEMTSGFDSQLINTLQFSKNFNICRLPAFVLFTDELLTDKTLEMDTSARRTASPPSRMACWVSSLLATNSALFSLCQLLRGSMSHTVDASPF